MAGSMCFLLFDRFEDLFDVIDFGRQFDLDVTQCRLDFLMAKGDLKVERVPASFNALIGHTKEMTIGL